jgi:hypothetical protein
MEILALAIDDKFNREHFGIKMSQSPPVGVIWQQFSYFTIALHSATYGQFSRFSKIAN